MNEAERPTSESTEPDAEPTEGTEPRGNPESDEDAVEQGKEQLDKVSGN